MRVVPESDVGVAMAAGALLVALFGVALGIVAVATPTDLGRRELVGFALGFGLFVAIYFGSMRADAILTGDRYEPDRSGGAAVDGGDPDAGSSGEAGAGSRIDAGAGNAGDANAGNRIDADAGSHGDGDGTALDGRDDSQ